MGQSRDGRGAPGAVATRPCFPSDNCFPIRLPDLFTRAAGCRAPRSRRFARTPSSSPARRDGLWRPAPAPAPARAAPKRPRGGRATQAAQRGEAASVIGAGAEGQKLAVTRLRPGSLPPEAAPPLRQHFRPRARAPPLAGGLRRARAFGQALGWPRRRRATGAPAGGTARAERRASAGSRARRPLPSADAKFSPRFQ